MSASIPQLKLFPLYRGGPEVLGRTGATGSLGGATPFNLTQTQFNAPYAVNIPPNVMRDFTNTYLSFNTKGKVEQRATSSIQDFDKPLWLGSGLGSVQQAPVPTVAPVIPNIYQDMVDLLSITEANFTDLMAQPTFNIPTIGMGIKVTTDGMGGVARIEVNPNSRQSNLRVGETNPAFPLPNRSEITTGAMAKGDPGVGLGGTRPAGSPAQTGNRPLPPGALEPALGNSPDLNLNNLGRNAGIFNLDRLGGPQGPQGGLQVQNPVQQRLLQLQPPAQGLALSGAGAAVAADQARQIATVQARLEVNTSNRFKENIADLASGSKSAESYASSFKPQSMDGRIPMAAGLPNASTNAGGGGNLGTGAESSFTMGGSVSDAMSRRGSGGYIPFQMQSQDQGMMSGGTGSGGFSGHQQQGMSFGGGQSQSGTAFGGQQQPRQQRKPLAFTA